MHSSGSENCGEVAQIQRTDSTGTLPDRESLGTFAADVQLYAQRSYPQFHASAQEELALHTFLRGLRPEGLLQHVRLAMPRPLDETLCEAERAEVVLSMRSPL